MIKDSSFIYLAFLVFFGLLHFSSCDQASKNVIVEKDVYVQGEMPVQHGMELFNMHCASCHNFTENLIGPNLSGVTSEVDKAWLTQFIKNPVAVIESGDKRAVELFEKFKQYMPPFPTLGDEDIEDILGFIHKFSQAEKRNKSNRKGGLINPVPGKIETSPLTLVLEKQFEVPMTSEVTPSTRINQMTKAPGERLFIHDLRGQLYEIIDGKQLTTFMNIRESLPNFVDNPGKASGFGSLCFHPDFQKNGLFYTTHTDKAASAPADFALPDSIKTAVQHVLLEWKVDNPRAEVFSGTHRELLRADMPSGAHTFQDITFNPLAKPNTKEFGLLYLGIGDGSAALRGYPFLCDNIQHIWGAVIRIDPLGNNSSNGKYGIPQDNPFVSEPNALGEIWAHGFRNAHRITWDVTGSEKMLITNIGQHSLEEVNLGIAGRNYGWPYREGTFLFDPEANVELVYPIESEDDSYTDPVVQYDHDEGSAVSGGFVYAGEKIPKLKGKYVFGDMSLGTLFYTNVDELIDGQLAPLYRLQVEMNGEVSDMVSITGNNRVDLRIGEDHEGELYLMTKEGGGVYKVIDCKEVALE